MSVGEYLDFCFIAGRSKTKSKGTIKCYILFVSNKTIFFFKITFFFLNKIPLIQFRTVMV